MQIQLVYVKRFHILNFNQPFSPLILTQLFIQILAFTATDILSAAPRVVPGWQAHQPSDPRHDVHIGKKVELLPLVGFLTHYLPQIISATPTTLPALHCKACVLMTSYQCVSHY